MATNALALGVLDVEAQVIISINIRLFQKWFRLKSVFIKMIAFNFSASLSACSKVRSLLPFLTSSLRKLNSHATKVTH